MTHAFVANGIEKITVVGGREMRSEQPDSRETDVATGQPREDDRESSNRAGRLDAIVRGVLGEMERLNAVGEQRRIALAEVEAPIVEDREVGDERHGRLPLLLSKVRQPGQELLIGQMSGSG